MLDPSLIEVQKKWHGSFQSYIIGFIVCLLLTSSSFFVVMNEMTVGIPLVVTLIGLAVLQAIAQLLFFMHVGKEPKPYWESMAVGFMALVVVIIVAGSLWIIYDLNERVMPMPH